MASLPKLSENWVFPLNCLLLDAVELYPTEMEPGLDAVVGERPRDLSRSSEPIDRAVDRDER